MTPAEFIAKWSKVELTERAAAQSHFNDLCDLLDHPKPVDVDKTGESFCFEKGAAKQDGGEGWADVWKRGFFGWEYKGRHKDLDAAYAQLLQYREALENPPLLVVCDMDRIVIRTNFTATATQKFEIELENLAQPRSLEVLRDLFHHPDKLRPGATSHTVTTAAARHFAELASQLRGRGLDAHQVAHFLDRIVFCLFAEDIGLLREGLFSDLVGKSRHDPPRFRRLIGQLFEAMAHGGDFGADTIRHFNGNLFAAGPLLDLTADEIERIYAAAELDWSAIDPSILGTLFERGLDPDKRSQLGAHYTSRADIETVVEPVVMQPLRRDWAETRQAVTNLLATGKKKAAAPAMVSRSRPPAATPAAPVVRGSPDPAPSPTEGLPAANQTTAPSRKPLGPQQLKKARGEAGMIVHGFLTRLANVKVLDPACGSGNFLYVTLQKLKDLEKEVILHAMECGLGGFLPQVGPWQLYGIEINAYAYELAQMTVWIGYLQWTRANGFAITQTPVLRPMDGNFFCMDAILDLSDTAHPKEPEWPKVDFIVSNPPFLGDKLMRDELGTDNTEQLWHVYAARLPATSNLCCYWFEKARQHIADGKCRAAGLLATTAIRQVDSRRVLDRIKDTGTVFFAVSNREWMQEGASVRVCLVGFAGKDWPEKPVLDGQVRESINADLTSGVDLSVKQELQSNVGHCFMGVTKVGDFDIEEPVVLGMLSGTNPNTRPNSDVLRPFRNGSDIVRAPSNRWIIDFGVNMVQEEASRYEAPFEYIVQCVKPAREKNNREAYRNHWWIHAEARPGFRKAVAGSARYLATPRVALHRVFIWLDTVVLPDSKVIAIAFQDDFHFGVLQSRAHESWTLATCGWHGVGDDVTYNPTTCFETFPFPEATPAQQAAIAAAAQELDQLRQNWLNPPEWTRTEYLEFPASVGGPWDRYLVGKSEIGNPQSETNPKSAIGNQKSPIGLVRYPRLVPQDAESAKKLAKRTLTNLYNERPTWLDLAHRKLDEAVGAAYGWSANLTDEQILERLLALNLERSAH